MEALAMNPEFWRGRPVLVTGHTGFKGSWLSWWLSHLGAKLAGLSLDPPTSPSHYESTGLAEALAPARADRRGDVRELRVLEEALAEHRPEVVFHLAAQSLVRESYRRPADTFATNVAGTVNCLEAARHCASVRAIVIVTTDKCYRNRGGAAAYRESDELGGDDPYSASKACAELATHAYRESFFRSPACLVASARAGNVLGGGDWAAERLVPDAMRAFAAKVALRVRNPHFTRPWQHVLEPLRGYLVLAERLHAGERSAAEAWNFGPDSSDVRPAAWIAEALARRWGEGASWQPAPEAGLPEAAELALDNSGACAELKWRPALQLEKALDWAVEWHKRVSHGAKARAVTLEQIDRYQVLCLQ